MGLVKGPYKVNGVPLRRVNQAYVIATSKKVDVSSVVVPADVDDDFFSRSGSKSGSDFTDGADDTSALPEDRKKTQRNVDAAVVAACDTITKAYHCSTVFEVA